MLRTSLLASLVIHLVLFLTVPKKKQEEKKPKPEENRTEVRIQPPKIQFFDLKENPEICKRIYIGVGITVNFLDSIVNDVQKGGPADKAGILKGDIFVDMCSDKEEGKICEVKILRGKDRIPKVFNVKLEKICAE